MSGSIKSLKTFIMERIQAKTELRKVKEELEIQTWGLKKTNQGIKLLYKELEKKNAELRKLDQLKTDFVSTVSHELRTPLSITKEGISLVLDKITGQINPQQEKILTVAKDNIDRLAKIINELLDISKIEAGRIELKKELVNIADLVRQVVVSFEPKVNKKGLELRINLPSRDIDSYVDADKITQVFTNLVSNALKFTEKGHIEIEVKELEDEIECSVMDTGIGISQDDLPKVFDKFQQFGRAAGAGEKGTGLGLSIAKGLIEIHRGRIWLESELDKGTKFSFTLSKYSSDIMFKDYVDNAIRRAKERDLRVSIIIVSIVNFDKIKQEFSPEKIDVILKEIEGILKGTLRRQGDIVVKDSGEIIVLLTDCNKENALIIEGRLEQGIDDYLLRQNLTDKVNFRFGSATYPDEARNDEELVRKAKQD